MMTHLGITHILLGRYDDLNERVAGNQNMSSAVFEFLPIGVCRNFFLVYLIMTIEIDRGILFDEETHERACDCGDN